MNDMTPDQAQAQLDRAEAARVGTDGDRRVHGLATAAFGLVVGAYVALTRVVDGTWAEYAVLGGYVVLLFGLVWWQKRAARTIPRHARRTGYLGLAGSIVLMLATVVWLNVRQAGYRAEELPDQPEQPLVLLAVALVVALPLLVAGLRIVRGPRR